jgi:hypothetical protein
VPGNGLTRYSTTGDDILQKINIAPKSTLPASTQLKDQAAQAGQLQKILEFVSGLIDPSGKSQPLGQVNGALGETSISAVGHSSGLCKLGSLSLMATAAFPLTSDKGRGVLAVQQSGPAQALECAVDVDRDSRATSRYAHAVQPVCGNLFFRSPRTPSPMRACFPLR